MTRLRADALLLLVAVIWGVAFVAQKDGNQSIGPLLFVAVRFFISTLTLIPAAVIETKRNPVRLKRADFVRASLVGLMLFIGIALQQIALVTTTATNGGFLSALYIVLVPFAAWFLQGTRVRPAVFLACVVSIVGAWLLSDFGAGKKLAKGDMIILIADIAWALHIVLTSKFIRRTHRPLFLSCAQAVVGMVLAWIGVAVSEPVILHKVWIALPYILYVAIVSGSIAYTIQIIAQKHTPASEAALIMSMESVFAAIAGAFFLSERLTTIAACGCALILLGVIIIEAGPLLRRRAS